ncbi:MAG: DNA repair protein RecN [bacterium]
MLKSLTIKNYALLADVEIHFGEGLNILTGETGAGKSILIGALATILGDRVDTTVLREGCSKAVIEGLFALQDNGGLSDYLKAQDLATDDQVLILRREIYDNGRSRAFVNDSPVQLSILQAVGDFLVDLHGQHEHQSLLKTPNHLRFIDSLGDYQADLDAVSVQFHQIQKFKKHLSELESQQKIVNEKKDLILFQLAEINKINPSKDEEEELLKEEKIVKNGEKLFKLTNEFYQILYEGEHSVFDKLSAVEHGLDELRSIDEQFDQHKNDCANARLAVEEISKAFQNYQSKIVFDPDRLEQIQSRIAELSGLKKKYGRSISEILKLRDNLQKEIQDLENLDSQISAFEEELDVQKKRFSQQCVSLSEKRKQVCQQLESVVPEILSYLGMYHVRFKTNLKYQNDPKGEVFHQGQTYLAKATGIDFAEFLISVNEGEDLKPLVKVASGGEISRIMLTLKSVAARKGLIPVLVFDEIDIGVSGRIAQAVGRKLKDISEIHQVICITHLPQIASMAGHHYSVNKIVKEGRTETTIKKLSDPERTEAIARLLAGEKVSETHLNSARELLHDAAVNSN